MLHVQSLVLSAVYTYDCYSGNWASMSHASVYAYVHAGLRQNTNVQVLLLNVNEAFTVRILSL